MKEEHADTILAALRPMLLKADAVTTSIERGAVRGEDGVFRPGKGRTIVLTLDGGAASKA